MSLKGSRLLPWMPSWTFELKDLIILNPYVTPMLPIKFRSNLTLFGRRDGSKNFKLAAILDTGTERFMQY